MTDVEIANILKGVYSQLECVVGRNAADWEKLDAAQYKIRKVFRAIEKDIRPKVVDIPDEKKDLEKIPYRRASSRLRKHFFMRGINPSSGVAVGIMENLVRERGIEGERRLDMMRFEAALQQLSR